MERPLVSNKKDFIDFIDRLSDDFLYNKSGWENDTIDTFLNAFSRYTNDIEGLYKNMNIAIDPNIPSWQLLADIFMGSKYYE